MAIGDIKTFDINYTGLSLQIIAIDLGGGNITFEVKCLSGSADINALYWSDGDATGGEGTMTGFNAKKDSALNMNGSGQAWDSGIKLSSAGLGTEGTAKPTYLTAGESLFQTVALDWNSLDTLGVRATSTSTPEGSIKGVDGDAFETPAPKISVDDVCVEEGNTATFTITMANSYPYDVWVKYSTTGGTATSDTDFNSTSGWVKITAGQTSVTIDIQTIEDTLDEGENTAAAAESFTLVIEQVSIDSDSDGLESTDLTSPTFIEDGSGTGCIIDDDTSGGGGGNDFPTWPQDISNTVLYFADGDSDRNDDGFTVIKIDNWPGLAANDDLDLSIEQIVDYLDDIYDVSLDSLLGVAIKGGVQPTQYFAYGDNNTNGTAPDSIPAGAPGLITPPAQGQVPGPLIDYSVNYDLIF
jgi:hypothetical protein